MQVDVVAGHAHAAAAAAGRRLDQHRIADLFGQTQGLRFVVNQALAAGHDGDAGLLGQLAGLVLVAEQLHRLVRRADELDLAVAADLGEMCVLGEEAVAGMDRLHVGDLGGADDAWRS